MKIYISDKYNLREYSLPDKVEDSFLINYVSYNGIEEDIIFTAENGHWTISSNYDISISDGVVNINKDTLKNFSFYQIKFSDLEDVVYLYCFSTPIQYFHYEIGNLLTISLGRKDGNIVYDYYKISDNQFQIYNKENKWYFSDNDSNDSKINFVNGSRCHLKELTLGDIIFTNGLKIIWMKDFIIINNPNNSVKTSLSVQKQFTTVGLENQYTPVKDTDKGIVLYQENQIFFHTPRMKSNLQNKVIKIENPPTKQINDDPPAILTLGATIIMGISSSISGIVAITSVTKNNFNIVSLISQIFVCISMLIGCTLLPILLNKYNKNKYKRKEQERQNKYREYLTNKTKEINQEIEKERTILYNNYLSIDQCTELINNKNNLWNREITDSDFLDIRLGIGDYKSKITIDAKVQEFSLEDDNLKDEVEKIINTPLILKEVPITVSLIENKVLPIIIDNDYEYYTEFINGLILQLMTYCSGMDLKIVVLTNEKNEHLWDYLKYIPYCCDISKEHHFFAINEEEMNQVSTYLEEIYNNRMRTSNQTDGDKKKDDNLEENIYKNFDEYYIIITDDFVSSKQLGIVEKVINSTINLGFSLLTIGNSLQNVPSKSNKFVQIGNNGGCISSMDLSNGEQLNFKVEILSSKDMNQYSSIIANIPVAFITNGSNIPKSINFLEMCKVSKIEQLNIFNRWVNNDPTTSLAAPIGINESGKLFHLDLHEKFQGPHGLVAGSTGSGKSEFIITFILSMAINYHPYEVQFVLIDYKGGGLAGAFENRETGIKIPHLIGTITNLDTSEMNRSLISIKSELQRRQKLFNLARNKLGESTVDIYKYQKLYRNGQVDEPISHLFIISDEFAELKSQQPEFMEELVSTARIGRSLGVHLILATQKPSGIVDDQIWSNSRFKVCFKVQTPEDSNELLKRTEAAYIKETGRFYLQVGYNESFELGQSAWAGAKYYPTDRIIKKFDDSIKFINNYGEKVKTINDVIKIDYSNDYGDQVTNIVKYLHNIAVREKIEFNQLWLPSIPNEIFLSELIKKYNYTYIPYQINPIIGEYDIPSLQQQKLLTCDLTNTGNLIIYGNPGTGKENLLMTLIYSTCLYHSPDEVNFYIMDFGAETLKVFNNTPQVGDVVLLENKDKISNGLLMLEKEINRRKELFSDYGGSYVSFLKNCSNKLPLIITIINGYENFAENYDEFIDFYIHLLRDSYKYGVIFIMTALTPGNISIRLSQNFNNKIALQLNDPFDYKYYLNAPYNLVPGKFFGRGIASVDTSAYEFQTAFIYYRDQINNAIKQVSDSLKQRFTVKAKEIPVIPKVVNCESLIEYIDDINNVPIGINCNDASVCRYNFINEKITKIIGNSILIENNFTINLINVLNSIPNVKIKIIDFTDSLINVLDSSIEYHNNEYTDTIRNIITAENETNCKIIYVMVGIGFMYDTVLDEGINILSNIFMNLDKLPNSHFILIDKSTSFKKITSEVWYSSIPVNNGIWVGKNVALQDFISIDNMSKSDANDDTDGIIYSVTEGKYTIIKGMGAGVSNE